jgi:AcrR family transcriptional regulator
LTARAARRLDAEEISRRRHAARRREIVERILPAVEELLQRGSYSTLTVEDILATSGVSRATFYRHFKDKSDLILALSEPALEDVRTAAIRPWDRGDAPTRAELQAVLREHFDIYRPHIPLLNALVEVSQSDPVVRERFQQGFAEVQRAIAEHIVEGQRSGYIRADVLADETAAWITWMAERGMSQLVATADEAGRDRLADSLAAMVWHSVYA